MASYRTLVLLLIAAPLVATPALAALTAPPAPEPVPDILDLTDAIDESVTVDAEHLPAPELADGVGPGSWLIIRMGGRTYGCSANFLWVDGPKLYLGSAGHCFLPAGATATHGPGADYDPAGTSVRACVSNCVFGGQSGFVLTGTLVQLGPVAYARSSQSGAAVGNDFGVVEIPAGVTTRPWMPVWGGPVGSAGTGVAQAVCFYGNGIVYGEQFLAKARAGSGVGVSLGSGSYSTIAPTSSGDSGMGVVRCGTEPGGIHGLEALGIHTHSAIVTAVPGLRYGTTIAKAQTMATQAGLSLSLVDAP